MDYYIVRKDSATGEIKAGKMRLHKEIKTLKDIERLAGTFNASVIISYQKLAPDMITEELEREIVTCLESSSNSLELLLNKDDPDLEAFNAEVIGKETLTAVNALMNKLSAMGKLDS